MPKGCCKNESQFIKIKENFTPTPSVNIPSTDYIKIFVLAFVTTFNSSLTENGIADLFADSHAPPGKPVSLNILYRLIRI